MNAPQKLTLSELSNEKLESLAYQTIKTITKEQQILQVLEKELASRAQKAQPKKPMDETTTSTPMPEEMEITGTETVDTTETVESETD